MGRTDCDMHDHIEFCQKAMAEECSLLLGHRLLEDRLSIGACGVLLGKRC